VHSAQRRFADALHDLGHEQAPTAILVQLGRRHVLDLQSQAGRSIRQHAVRERDPGQLEAEVRCGLGLRNVEAPGERDLAGRQ
jgi:hypothetical protein